MEMLYNIIRSYIHSFNKDLGLNNSAQVEHHSQNILMASYGEVKVKLLVTPTSKQLERPRSNGSYTSRDSDRKLDIHGRTIPFSSEI